MRALLLMAFLFALMFKLEAKTADTLTGVWKANIKGVQSVYQFSKDSCLSIAQGKDTLMAVYTLDTAQAWPRSIDVKVLDRNTKQVIFIQRGLYEYFGPGKLRFRLGAEDKPRPSSFLPRGNEETLALIKQP